MQVPGGGCQRLPIRGWVLGGSGLGKEQHKMHLQPGGGAIEPWVQGELPGPRT